MGKATLEGYQCERCGYKWVKRPSTPGDPEVCPSCKSFYWNKPRVRKRKEESQHQEIVTTPTTTKKRTGGGTKKK